MTTPDRYKELYSRPHIAKEVHRVGKEISTWCDQVWRESSTEVLTIPVLKGGIFFFADLVREITCSVQIAPARSWAYHPGENAHLLPSVKVDLDAVPAKGRHVLIIDDICDSGKTLKVLEDSLYKMGALQVKTAVLIHREVAEAESSPDWRCFYYKGKEWIVGYGMDDAERWRNLPFVGIITTK